MADNLQGLDDGFWRRKSEAKAKEGRRSPAASRKTRLIHVCIPNITLGRLERLLDLAGGSQ